MGGPWRDGRPEEQTGVQRTEAGDVRVEALAGTAAAERFLIP
jgi:hypothetical protein